MTRTHRRTAGIAAALCLLLASGCQRQFSYANWDKIRLGETRQGVRNMFGRALVDQPDRLTYTDQDAGVAVEMRFDPNTGKLIWTQWADPSYGVRAKGNPPGEPTSR